MNRRRIMSYVRLAISFAMIGAVTAGVFTGWQDNPPIDFRALGAGVGAVAGVITHALHLA